MRVKRCIILFRSKSPQCGAGRAPYLQGAKDGAGGVHEEEAQVAQDIGEGKQALGHQDGVEGVPVLPLRVVHVLELRDESKRNKNI